MTLPLPYAMRALGPWIYLQRVSWALLLGTNRSSLFQLKLWYRGAYKGLTAMAGLLTDVKRTF